MIGTDQQPDTAGLSPTSRRMLALREAVLAEWEARVRASLDRAKELSHPILIDTLPAFYDNIAQALSADYPRADGRDGTTVAIEHGGERARITAYDHESLIREYQLFRWAIYDVLHREGVQLSRDELLTLETSIDNGIQEAVSGFVMVHTALRERFAAALTHDLRGPLSTIASALELIGVLDDPVRMKTLAARALENVHRMDGMIRDLLDTMAFHSGERMALTLGEFDIVEAIREIQGNVTACGGVPIDVIAPAPVRGWWDRSAMGRAIENLVSNAVKYGRAGGPVTISAAQLHDRLQLTVHNEGNPIPLEEQESIFQMYRRSARARHDRAHGWGIGLPYVRAVAESHAGSIAVDSHPHRGTTFTIDTPLDCRPYDARTVDAPPGA
ncbi:HAMP domain-containing sensor histidine kinase [Massilia sp. METH4]|uniref:sensor histidine kinase n=1 Tax=Massilia sp. METH4 TaxID=3123041 RepID=UPI0030D1B19B